MDSKWRFFLSGLAAGGVCGVFGAGGGMILVPLLASFCDVKESEVFPFSVSVMLPVCLVSLLAGANGIIPISQAIPYLLGGAAGGIIAAKAEKKIPVKWLHRFLGLWIVYGGVRQLW